MSMSNIMNSAASIYLLCFKTSKPRQSSFLFHQVRIHWKLAYFRKMFWFALIIEWNGTDNFCISSLFFHTLIYCTRAEPTLSSCYKRKCCRLEGSDMAVGLTQDTDDPVLSEFLLIVLPLPWRELHLEPKWNSLETFQEWQPLKNQGK